MASRRELQREDTHLRVMGLLPENPEISTRQIAEAEGISHGSAYYVQTALFEKCFVKLGNFKTIPRKGQYEYLLTQQGIYEKSLLAHSFVECQREEFAVLQAEIKALGAEAGLKAGSPLTPRGST